MHITYTFRDCCEQALITHRGLGYPAKSASIYSPWTKGNLPPKLCQGSTCPPCMATLKLLLSYGPANLTSGGIDFVRYTDRSHRFFQNWASVNEQFRTDVMHTMVFLFLVRASRIASSKPSRDRRSPHFGWRSLLALVGQRCIGDIRRSPSVCNVKDRRQYENRACNGFKVPRSGAPEFSRYRRKESSQLILFHPCSSHKESN